MTYFQLFVIPSTNYYYYTDTLSSSLLKWSVIKINKYFRFLSVSFIEVRQTSTRAVNQ